jgi:hypothetical protein
MKNKSFTAVGAELGIVLGIVFSVFIYSWLTYESQLDVSVFEVSNLSVGLVVATLVLLLSIAVVTPFFSISAIRKAYSSPNSKKNDYSLEAIIRSVLQLNAALAGSSIVCIVIGMFAMLIFSSLEIRSTAISQATVLYGAYLIMAALTLAVVETIVLVLMRSLATTTKKK